MLKLFQRRKLFISFRFYSNTPLSKYESLVQSGQLKADEHQRTTVCLLNDLHSQLKNYEEPKINIIKPEENSGWFGKWSSNKKKQTEQVDITISKTIPKGIYLFGNVGTGKTFLMDLFFESCSHIKRKKRVHFHSFMLDVHKRIHKWRISKRSKDDYDPIPPLADSLSKEAYLLCFDEFQVNDVADASILHRLFKQLYERGAVVVSTSNRAPEDLYQNGLQRELFLPFIDWVYVCNTVHCLDSGLDYRLSGQKSANQVYFIGEKTQNSLEELFNRMKGESPNRSIQLPVHNPSNDNHSTNRFLTVDRCSKRLAFFTFDQLCRKPLGAAEFIALANNFDTIFIDGVPRMTVHEKNEARRFIVLIDEMYEHRVKLVIGAQVKPNELFVGPSDVDSARNKHSYVRAVSQKVEADLREELLEKKGVSDFSDTLLDAESLFSGQEEAFMFARAASRLFEMQTTEYLEKNWKGQPWI